MLNVKQICDFDSGRRTLVLPSISIANLGQLAVDLLINTLGEARLMAYMTHASLLPFYGPSQFPESAPNARSMPVEVYQNADFIFLQIRSRPIPVLHIFFADNT